MESGVVLISPFQQGAVRKRGVVRCKASTIRGDRGFLFTMNLNYPTGNCQQFFGDCADETRASSLLSGWLQGSPSHRARDGRLLQCGLALRLPTDAVWRAAQKNCSNTGLLPSVGADTLEVGAVPLTQLGSSRCPLDRSKRHLLLPSWAGLRAACRIQLSLGRSSPQPRRYRAGSVKKLRSAGTPLSLVCQGSCLTEPVASGPGLARVGNVVELH